MKARRAAVEWYAFSQPAECPVNGAGGQPVSSHRNEEILGERKLLSSATVVSPQWGQSGRMQRHQARFPE